MADLMEERVRSAGLTAGLAFAAGALCLALSIVFFPPLPPANETNRVLEVLVKQDNGGWMWLHAFMTLGFLLATVGFVAFGFQLHFRGSSGPASIAMVAALAGGTIWAVFLSAELFVHPFVKNLMGVEPGLATMLFNTYWFWKMGAIWVAGLLFFAAVIAAGLAATARGLLPVHIGWSGPVFATIGIVLYLIEFMNATTTGAAINPMRSAIGRWGVGLPLQAWLLAVGATLIRDYLARVTVLPPNVRTPVPKREVIDARTGERL